MVDEVVILSDYLPLDAKDPRISKLISHHLDHLLRCVENGLYSSSLVHLHLLYMIFIYIQIQRIANRDLNAYRYGLIGFARDESDILKEANYPLLLAKINESTVFRFFRLCGIDDDVIKKLAKPVKLRNEHLHASEKIECETEDEFEIVFYNYLSNMDLLLDQTEHILKDSYLKLENFNRLNERGYQLSRDDIELGVLQPGYFSKKELVEHAIKGERDKLSTYIRKQYA